VVHHGQGLAFGLETGDDLPGVHARLDDLQRHPTADGVRLLGHEDDAHAPLADLFEQLVRPDDRAGMLGDLGRVDGDVNGGDREEARLLVVHAEQRLQSVLEVPIRTAEVPEIGRTRLGLLDLPGHLEDGLFIELDVVHGRFVPQERSSPG